VWVFTKYGFYSAVSALDGKNKVDPTRVVVRARVRVHLTALLRRFPKELVGVKVTSSDQSDYRYRVVVGKAAWRKVLDGLAAELDYGNFKNACGQGEYHDALTRVWNVMYGMQANEKGNRGVQPHYEEDV
jgi:hypothetical protein